MTLILHLSDLHLVAPTKSKGRADEKAGLLQGTGASHYDMLRRTFAQLAERLGREHRALDAIVMSGDVADRNDEGGYDAFLGLLDELGVIKPVPEHILVVPGNHDVFSGLTPGDGQRYQPFAQVMRGAGFVTPVLEGVDPRVGLGTNVSRHVLRVGDLEIVPLNSSGYSQVQLHTGLSAEQWAAMERAIRRVGGGTEVVNKGLTDLRRLGKADAARISEAQLEDVAKLMQMPRAKKRGPVVRIAVLHHQLLPVSTDEEVKPFESFTNLGLLRQFLRDHDFSIVLHGHKHAQYTYVDHIASYDEDAEDGPRAVRVMSGPAPVGSTFNPDDVGRLLTIDARSGMLAVERVRAAEAGKRPRPGKRESFPIAVPGGATTIRTSGVTLVDGQKLTPVHARLVSTLSESGEISNLVCRLGASPGITEISSLYEGFEPPDLETSDSDAEATEGEKIEQFRELVDWWQNPVSMGARGERSFTHGNRIFRYQGHVDQLEEIAAALRKKHDTSRGVLVLLSPAADRVGEVEHEFPSFCLVQFLISRQSHETAHLECVAFFRKLEVRYWWLVNVAELASLQQRLIDLLSSRYLAANSHAAKLVPGSITTIAARAHVGSKPLRVQVPRIDRYYVTARERLYAMVHALVWAQVPDRETYAKEWMRILTELVPSEHPDPNGMAVAIEGVRCVHDAVTSLTETHQGDSELALLADVLGKLLHANEIFARDQRLNEGTLPRHEEWRSVAKPLVEGALELTVARILRS